MDITLVTYFMYNNLFIIVYLKNCLKKFEHLINHVAEKNYFFNYYFKSFFELYMSILLGDFKLKFVTFH